MTAESLPEPARGGDMKVCSRCAEAKATSEFYFEAAKARLKSACKCCCRRAVQEAKRASPEKYQKAHIRYAAIYAERNRSEKPENVSKVCGICRETKPASAFQRNACSQSGLTYLCKACRSAKRKARRASDPLWAVTERVRARVAMAVRAGGYQKLSKTAEMLGCSWGELERHLERQFAPGMSWANRDHWHIDHIIPVGSASNEQELLRLCHFTNLRPLWADENLKKNARALFLI